MGAAERALRACGNVRVVKASCQNKADTRAHAARRRARASLISFVRSKHANAGRIRARSHRADAHTGPRRALPRAAFEPVHMARRMAPSKQAGLVKRAHLNGRCGTVARVEDPVKRKYTVTLDEAMDDGDRELKVSEDRLLPEPV